MNDKFQFLVISTITFLLSACANIYHSPDYKQLSKKHNTIAIIPPTILIGNFENIDSEVAIQQKAESLNLQMEMYAWMLKKKKQESLLKDIQPIQTTNALLQKAGYPETPFTNAQICDILGVDGVINSYFGLSKPVPDNIALTTGIIFNAWLPTNEINSTLSIDDCEHKKLIWNFNYKASGLYGSTPSRFVNQIMNKASLKMPYIVQ